MLPEIAKHRRLILPVSSEGSSFVRADGRGVAHGFASVQVPHQIVIFHHFLGESHNIVFIYNRYVRVLFIEE